MRKTEFIERLDDIAEELGLGFYVKPDTARNRAKDLGVVETLFIKYDTKSNHPYSVRSYKIDLVLDREAEGAIEYIKEDLKKMC